MSTMPPPAPVQSAPGPGDEDRAAWYRRAWVGWVGGILLGLVIGIAGGGSADEDGATAASEPLPAETITVTATPTAPATPQAAETVTIEAEPQPAETVTVEPEPLPAETVTVTETAPAGPPASGGAGLRDSYTAGQFTFADVQVRSDFVEDFEVVARVTNDGDAVEGVSWTVTLFTEGSVVGTASGFASGLEAGSTTTQTFITSDDFTDGVDEIEFQVDSVF